MSIHNAGTQPAVDAKMWRDVAIGLCLRALDDIQGSAI